MATAFDFCQRFWDQGVTYDGTPGVLLAAPGAPLGCSWGALGGSWAPPGAHFGSPAASWGSFLASWSLLGLISGLLAPPGVHFWPPGACSGPFWTHVWLIVRTFRGTSLNFPPSSRKHCSKSLVKRSFEKSKTLFETLVKRFFETTAGQTRTSK